MFFLRNSQRSNTPLFIPLLTGMVFCSLITPTQTQAQSLSTTLTLQTAVETLTVSEQDIASWLVFSTVPSYASNPISEIEDIHTCPLPEKSYCDIVLPRALQTHIHIVAKKDILDEKLREFIRQAAQELNENPVNAILTAKDGAVIVETPEKPGFRVDTDQMESTLRSALLTDERTSPTVIIPGSIIPPDIKGSDIERLGIKELIAEGTTNFAGSPKNRIFNIDRALKQFQGILIAPNEEFSFVKYLGPVDGESGYLPELVIKNNRTEPEFGGGICQVSSTVFRTAIYAGLKITARRNHAYPVSYYKPYGMDATIYIPNPDLKFINNTPGYIFLQPSVSGTRLTFQMYGTNDRRKVEVDGPHIIESQPDGSLRTIFTQTVNNMDGQNFIRDSFPSNYKSPLLFPHPGDEILKTKPANWSKKQWGAYLATRPR